MKKTRLLLMACMLPMALHAEETTDTTFLYQDKQIVVADSAGTTNVKVLDKLGDTYRKTFEGHYTRDTEEERFYITSPFVPKTYRRMDSKYKPLTPAFYIGWGTLPKHALGLGNNKELHVGDWGSWEAGLSLLSVERSWGRWGLSANMSLSAHYTDFKRNYILGNDEEMRSVVVNDERRGMRGHMFYLGESLQLMGHYLIPMGRDRLSIGIGLSLNMHGNEHTYWSKSSNYNYKDKRYAESAYLNMHPFSLGLRLQVGYNGQYLMIEKTLTPLFSTRNAPRCFPFMIGVGFTF